MTKMDIDRLLQNIEESMSCSETQDMEFKAAKGGFPGSFWETYSAFANTEGGLIVLGVKEHNHQFSVDSLGKETIEKYKKDFWNAVNSKSTVNKSLLMEDDVIDVSYGKGYILIFRIPRADRSQRPIYKGFDPYSGTFKRNYEGDYKCTDDEVRRMFADADDNRPADSRILSGYTMNDIDGKSLEQFRRLFATSKPDHPWLALNDIELLTKLGGYRIDRKTQNKGFTLAGLLMFGKTESITDTECAPHFFPDYRLYASENSIGTERWIDRICPDGTWEANLFQFYRMVLPKLTSALPRPFLLDEDTRIDETTAHVALREALINLCIHADYSVNASLVIRQYPHRIIMSNPGTLLVSRMQYYIGGESVCRNKSLQKMFTMFGKAEKAGSGTDKILQGWQDQNWKIPLLRTFTQPDKVELLLLQESILPDRTKEKLIDIFGDECLKWERNKLLAMSVACTEGEISNESLQFVLHAHRTDITTLLRNLKEEGLLESNGYGRGTRYRIPGSLVDKSQSISSLNQSMTSSDQSMTSSDQSMTSPDQGMTSSGRSMTSFGQSMTSSEQFPVCSKHYKKEDLQQQILDYCNEYRSAESIAKHFCHNVRYIQNRYLKPLEDKGLVTRLHPDKSRHPYQKYIAVEQS